MLLSFALRSSSNRFIKRIIRPMMGFKAFHFATATIAGVEVAHMIRKGKFTAKYLCTFQQFAGLAASPYLLIK
jgi:putative transposase